MSINAFDVTFTSLKNTKEKKYHSSINTIAEILINFLLNDIPTLNIKA